MRPTDLRGEALGVFEMWRNLGLSESAAMDEVRRAGYLGHPEPFDDLVGVFESLGLNPREARAAAIGRATSEHEARESFILAYTAQGQTDARDQLTTEVDRLSEEAAAAMARRHGTDPADARASVSRHMVGLSEVERLRFLRRYLGMFGATSLQESAGTLAMGSLLCESARLVESQGNRRYRVKLIAGNVQGSSGYYSEAMLRRDGPKVFREGLPVFLDHPTASERAERPERSVRDLAGRLVTTAAYESDGLYATVQVYPHVAPLIEGIAADVGVSIRAYGTAEESTIPGVRGPIITELTGAESVDFVTAAGAGGRIVGDAR